MKDGYRYADVPPISSWVMIANGQQPTDSLSAGDSFRSSRSSGAASRLSHRARPQFDWSETTGDP